MREEPWAGRQPPRFLDAEMGKGCSLGKGWAWRVNPEWTGRRFNPSRVSPAGSCRDREHTQGKSKAHPADKAWHAGVAFISLCQLKSLCSNFIAGRHQFNNLQSGAKWKTLEKLHYSQAFKQRHLPNSYGSIVVSIILTQQYGQHCPTLPMSKAMHHVEKI